MTGQGKITVTRSGKPLRVLPPADIPDLDDEQRRASHDMALDKRKLLFSDPGAGKTLTTLDALCRVWAKFDHAPRVLIVCPPIAVFTWLTWTGAMVARDGWDAHIDFHDRSNRAVTAGANILVVTYGLLSRKSPELVRRLTEWGPEVVIADECDNLSGWTSNRTQALLGDDFASGIVGKATYKWFLSGTPIPRYNDGLYPVMRAVVPEKLAEFGVLDKQAFLGTFAYVDRVKYGAMKIAKEVVIGSKNNRLLHSMLYSKDGSYVAAIRNKLVLKDKPIFSQIALDFRLSKELVKLEEALEASGGRDDDGMRSVDPRMATALRLLGEECVPQVVEHLTTLMHKARLACDPKGIVCLYWHTSVGDEIANRLGAIGYRVGRISGATTPEQDAATEAAFNNGSLDFVVGQIKAMGVAINLQQNCATVVFAEESFSAASNLQAYQRVWRRGQTHPVRVFSYVPLQSSLKGVKAGVVAKKAASARKALDGEQGGDTG